MKRNFFRITLYSIPTKIGTPDLHTLALMSNAFTVLEGILRTRPRVEGRIDLRGIYREGHSTGQIHVSTRILRAESNYFLTAKILYQVLRVPHPKSQYE
jgi:hypothetical protein